MSGVPVAPDYLIENGFIVESLQGALRDGAHGLAVAPSLLKRVIREGRWTERKVRVLLNDTVTFQTFAQFVTTHPPEGLATDIKTLRRICRDDAEALDLIDQAEQAASQPGQRTDLVDNINEVERPTGTSQAAALRRLRKDRPDLHQQVLAGALSPHAAMVAAGFRKRAATVVLDPESFAQAALKYLTREQVALLATRLLESVHALPSLPADRPAPEQLELRSEAIA